MPLRASASEAAGGSDYGALALRAHSQSDNYVSSTTELQS